MTEQQRSGATDDGAGQALPDDPTMPLPAPGRTPEAGEAAPGSAEPEVRPLDPPDPVAPEEPVAPDGPHPDGDVPEPEPFSEGPPPLPEPMLVLGGDLPPDPAPTPAPEPEDHGTCAACGGAYDADGWCTQCGERRPDPRHHFSAAPSSRVAAVCDRGLRHTSNEDAMAVWAETGAPDRPDRAALVVCDGVSSAPRSDEASLAAANAAVAALTEAEGSASERLVRATDAAAAAVAEVAGATELPDGGPSCTFVAGVVEGAELTVGSVGDSRAYWIPDDGEPVRLTTDDSMAEEQIQAGMDRAEAEAGPLGHTITRWLGPDSPDHRPRLATQDVSAPGWVLLCSDGLWNYASEPADLAAVVRAEAQRADDSLALAEALVGWANGRGGADNVTVALARREGDRQDGAHG